MKIQEVSKVDFPNNQVNHNGEINEKVSIENHMKLFKKLNEKKKVDKQ